MTNKQKLATLTSVSKGLNRAADQLYSCEQAALTNRVDSLRAAVNKAIDKINKEIAKGVK